ncbi:MAG: MarR family transcriptional regulator [Candidatus Pacearchaeota archaeon]|nr:MarR family transcriptional regulator [Candidatus Pacearchaeota archaeon]
MEEEDYFIVKNKNKQIKEYIKKINNPTNFISKIINTLPYSFSIIDVNTNKKELSNNGNYQFSNNIQTLKDIKKIKKPVTKTYNYINKNREKKTIEIHSHPILDQNKNLIKIIEYCIDITNAKEKLLEENLNKLKKEKEKLELKIKLPKTKPLKFTPKEKLVFYAVCKYPLLRDEELSKKINLKRSTVTAIKNRLKKNKIFGMFYIPNIKLLGGSQFSIIQYKFVSSQKDKKQIQKDIEDTPEIIVNLEKEQEIIIFFTSKQYTDLQKFHTNFTNKYSNILTGEDSILTFFYDLDNFYIFTFQDLINESFILLKNESSSNIFPNEMTRKKLNNNEKRILHYLVKYPNDTIAQISKKTWISKPTVSKVKKNLIKNKYLLPIIFPNFKKINYNILAIISSTQKNSKLKSRIIAEVNNNKTITQFVLFKSKEEFQELAKSLNLKFKILIELDKMNLNKINLHALIEKLIF